MRDFVISISAYGKGSNSDFVVIPQNGIELVTSNGENTRSPKTPYLSAIDGNGQEDLFYGYNNDDKATPAQSNAYFKTFLDISKNAGNPILGIDYCSTISKKDDSYEQNNTAEYISFAADDRDLRGIPEYPENIYNENTTDVSELSQAENFLFLINLQNYTSKTDFINAVSNTNYDVIIMDLFFADGTAFTASEIDMLKTKSNGGKRMVISYMSIGEAEDYRYYWESDWNSNKPSWLDVVNPKWPGNYKVKYWEEEWQAFILGNESAYLDKVLTASFDGVYLDIIDAFEYFENLE